MPLSIRTSNRVPSMLVASSGPVLPPVDPTAMELVTGANALLQGSCGAFGGTFADRPIELVSPDPGLTMAAFLGGLGVQRGDTALAEAAGVQGATIFGWGERSLPADLGSFVGALVYVNEALAGRSGLEETTGVRQIDPLDFLRLAFGERGRAFFDSVVGDHQIVVRYPAYWGEFAYADVGIPFALQKPRTHLGATDADLSRSVDELIADVTVAGHRRGKVPNPQRMWNKTRAAFGKMFSVRGNGGDAIGESLLFFLTYLPYFDPSDFRMGGNFHRVPCGGRPA